MNALEAVAAVLASSGGETLEHHGVKGMKWGVRRDGSKGSSRTKSAPPDSEDAKKAGASREVVKKHGTSKLSNQELQHLVNRMNLEQQYSKLKSQGTSSGIAFTKRILADVGKQQLKQLANEQAAKQIALLMAKSAARAAAGG